MSASGEFYSIPAAQVEQVWPMVESHIERALARTGGEYIAADILEALLSAQAQLWVPVGDGVEGALVTKIVDYPRSRVCELWLCGGDWNPAWGAYLGMVEDWARSVGCRAVRIYGRRGWTRKLGYLERCTLAERWL